MALLRNLVLSICLATANAHSGYAETPPFLLRDPAVSETQIAFAYAGNIWTAKRDGSAIRRLTSAGHEAMPVFSPDGSQIAFTGDYDGGHGIYIVSTAGGEPRRLTYNPADVAVVGWTPNGARILFTSKRAAYARGVIELYSIPAGGGFATPLPLGRVSEGALSPGATRLAYVPGMTEESTWKDYRGGATTHIQIVNLADSRIEDAVPRENSNDSHPMWVGDTLYFLSDRAGPVTLFAYDLNTHQVRQIVKNENLDIKSASASTDAIVYEQFGSLHLLDLKTGTDRALDLRPTADFPEVRPHFEKIEPKKIRFAAISPDGAAAVFGVHGEVLTVASTSGEIRNLTNTPSVVERDPAWAPDGRSIAYFSDESGEYALHIRDLSGLAEVRKVNLGDPPSFYSAPVWSVDSTKIAYTDSHLNYWYVDLTKKTSVRVDTDLYVDPAQGLQLAWSPDSRWIAYTRQLRSHLHAVFIYSLQQAKSYQVTDGMSDAMHAVFDKNGKYLYFTASTDVGPSTSWLDMSGRRRPVSRSIYAIMLTKDLPSPLAPNGDAGTAKPKTAGAEGTNVDLRALNPVRIDLEGISQRIVTLPVPTGNYYDLIAAKPGVLFLVEGPTTSPFQTYAADFVVSAKIYRFDLQTRNTDEILEDIACFFSDQRIVSSFHLSSSGDKMLYERNGQWFITVAEKLVGTSTHAQPSSALSVDSMEIYVDPRAAWRHMFVQVWRDEREFFYDPHLHGLDLEKVNQRYTPFLDNIVTRDDLNYLFSEMLGNLSIGHLVAWGGDRPQTRHLETGLLGADFAVANGRYRFARIYSGDPWNPKGQGPLTQPGMNVHEGDYLLMANQVQIRPTTDVYSYFEETAGKQVVLTIGPNPDGVGSRRITVVPVADETPLRNYAWIESNRRKVDELTGGRVAYVYLPDTAERGYASFNRYYFAQVGKEAAIIDERDNGGGEMADYIIDYLRRPLLSYWHMRDGGDVTTPQEVIFGPKVLITNEWSASGGDGLAWMFRKAGIGPLIGNRTKGALVGIHVLPGDLLDGGGVSAPNLAFYSPDGTWDIENHGVSPDIEVEEDPRAEREGHDLQLERAVAAVLDLLNKSPSTSPPRHPPFPSYPHDGVQ
jgi:tricorn protease